MFGIGIWLISSCGLSEFPEEYRGQFYHSEAAKDCDLSDEEVKAEVTATEITSMVLFYKNWRLQKEKKNSSKKKTQKFSDFESVFIEDGNLRRRSSSSVSTLVEIRGEEYRIDGRSHSKVRKCDEAYTKTLREEAEAELKRRAEVEAKRKMLADARVNMPNCAKLYDCYCDLSEETKLGKGANVFKGFCKTAKKGIDKGSKAQDDICKSVHKNQASGWKDMKKIYKSMGVTIPSSCF